MNTVKSQAMAYLGIALAFFGLWLLASGCSKVVVLVVATASALSCLFLVCSLKCETPWVKKVVGILRAIRLSHLFLFLGLFSLAVGLIHEEFVEAGIAVLYIAYIVLAIGISRELAYVLRDVYNRWRRRRMS